MKIEFRDILNGFCKQKKCSRYLIIEGVKPPPWGETKDQQRSKCRTGCHYTTWDFYVYMVRLLRDGEPEESNGSNRKHTGKPSKGDA